MMNAGRRIRIRGTVQGVGFRPWVTRIAREIGVAGRVRNDPQGVTIEAFGPDAALTTFLDRLRSEAPPPARVRELVATAIPAESAEGFFIDASGVDGAPTLSIPPDLATCTDCERELLDPQNRRHHYPFTNCTHCGPRYTIATGVPYDRPATTMAGFTMCPDCAAEYAQVTDRRYRAQPNACPRCGPRLAVLTASGSPVPELDPPVPRTGRPSTTTDVPLIQLARGEHRKATTSPTSSSSSQTRRAISTSRSLKASMPCLSMRTAISAMRGMSM